MTVAATITVNPIGHAAPVSAGDEADWTHPTLGETWHGAVTGIHGRTAAVRWHSYTPRGGGRRKPMRHASRVPAHALTPGRRRVAIKALTGGREPLAVKAQPDNTGGSMLALYPPPRLADALTVPDGLPAGEIHLTVAYTGDAADVDPAALQAVAGHLARRSPVTAAIAGHARFTGDDDHDVIVALADGSDLENLRRDAMDRLSAHGITVPRDHGYTPHLTLRYARPGDPDPVGRLKPAPVTFAGISAVHGGDRTDYPFTGDPAEVTRRPAAPGRPPKPEHAGGEMSTPATKALFAEDRHPRGHDGKWIEIGHDVTLPGGLHGKVTGMHGNRVLVDAADGTHRVVPAAQVTSNGPAAHGGFQAMHAPVGEASAFNDAQGVARRKDGEMANPAYPTHKSPGVTGGDRFGVPDSLAAHTLPDGSLDPARKALHDQIIKDALAGHQPQAHPVATFMGGGPASGKSHMPGQVDADTVHIDPDQVKLRLPEYAEKGVEGAAYTHEESSMIAKRIEKQAIVNRYNLTLDGVGNSTFENMSRRIKAAKAGGYTVRARYITITTDEALKRNETRLADIGRWVPPEVIKVKYARVSQVFPQLIKAGLPDEAELWNNNVPKGSPPKMIGRKAAGGEWQVEDPVAWKRFLADAAGAAPGSGSS